MVERVLCRGRTVVMMVTDEVEHVTRAKIHGLLAYFYAELCRRKVYRDFQCEVCESKWCTEKDHSKTEYQVFYELYTGIKNEVRLDMLQELCTLFFKLADLPVPQVSVSFINNLSNKSSHTVCSLWRKMVYEEEEPIHDFIVDLCDRHEGYTTSLSTELFSWFIEYLQF